MFSNRSRKSDSSSSNSSHARVRRALRNSVDEDESGISNSVSEGSEVSEQAQKALKVLGELFLSFKRYQNIERQDGKFKVSDTHRYYKIGDERAVRDSLAKMEEQASAIDYLLKQINTEDDLITQEHIQQFQSIIASDNAFNIPPHVISRDAVTTIKEILTQKNAEVQHTVSVKESKYEHQIIIDYGRGATSSGLTKKRSFVYGKQSNRYTPETMAKILEAAKAGRVNDPQVQEFLALITPKTRIYLIGHTLRSQAVHSDNPQDSPLYSFGLDDLALLIGLTGERMRVDNLNDYSGPLLKICFVSCQSKLMAYNCAALLRQNKVPAEVVGKDADQIRGTYFQNSNNYHKLSGVNENYYHQYKTVKIVTTDEKLSIEYKGAGEEGPTDLDSRKRVIEADVETQREDADDEASTSHTDKKMKR
jgi:ribosomal protein S17